MSYEFFIGLRYLKAKRKQAFLSLITLISIVGVALGVMALIVVLSVMSGFENDLRNKILGMNAHIRIHKRGEGISNYPLLIREIRGIPHVVGVSPFTYNEVMISSGRNVSGVVLRGIDPLLEGEATDLRKYLKEGHLNRLAYKAENGRDGIILGRELARGLGVSLGERLNVVSPLGGILTPFGMAPKTKPFNVVGIFEAGMYEYDSKLAFISIPAAQEFFGMGRVVSGLEVKLDDIYAAKRVAREIQKRLGFSYFIQDWMQMNRNLFSALKHEKVLLFIILVMIILVAAFGIASNLIMMVMEKNKDIAILKSMGATSRSIMRIFMIEGLVIGSVGTTLGLLGGLAVSFKLESIASFLERLLGFEAFPKDVYYLDRIPSQVNSLDVLAVIVTAMVISFLATIYPSWQASRLDPVVALRYE